MKKNLKKKLPKAANGLRSVTSEDEDNEDLMGGIQGGASLLAGGLSLLDASRKKESNGRGGTISSGGTATGILGSAASGAATGASFGPWGAAAGGIIGAGMGILEYNKADKQRAEELKQKELFEKQQVWDKVRPDVASNSQRNLYKRGVKKLDLGKPSQASVQDATSPRNIYKGGNGIGTGGASELRKTAKAATAILGLAKAIPTPLTQAVGWGASALSAGMGVEDAYDDVKKKDYGSAALNLGGAALDMVPLNISKAGRVGKTIDLLKKGSKAKNVRSATNAGVRMAQSAALANDGSDVLGAYNTGTKAIEIEGGEPHFSKKVGGKRTLKQYHPGGPTHEQGGIRTIAAEGDAIVTAKGAKGEAAVKAYLSGDHQTVEKIINSMPADKDTPKKSGGSRGVKPGSKGKRTYEPRPLTMPGTPIPSLVPRTPALQLPPASGLPGTLATIPLPTGEAPGTSSRSKWSAGVSGAIQALPTLYNLGQGLFGETEKTTRRGYSPEMETYQDLSEPQRRASRQAQNQQVANARNLSGGSAGNVRANANQAFADNAARQSSIDAQESGRLLTTNNNNVETRNRAQVVNNAMNNEADQLDLQNSAKKSEALALGLQGIGALSANQQLLGNTKEKEAADRAMLSEAYRTMTIDPATGKPVLRSKLSASIQRKGTKAIKTKKC